MSRSLPAGSSDDPRAPSTARTASDAGKHRGRRTAVWRPANPPLASSSDASSPTWVLADDEMTGDDPAPMGFGDRLPGSRLRVLECITKGGCGVVYRGEHVDLQRPLAIKVQRREALSPVARQLFLDEARTTTRIDSVHVVQVVDFGELADGRVWYAMPLLGGRTLDQLIIDERRLAPARVIDLLRMACKGLTAAHDAGVVHRDVKPQNLIVIERGGREHLVLVDFGIALPLGHQPPSLCGTPEYMAPEQIERGILDERTDVYSLGCCAFEMLTGSTVVDGDTIEQVLDAHRGGITPRFAADDVIPAALRAVIRKCVELDPDDRHADMRALEAALCEAQIAAGYPNARDDIELPAIEARHRRQLADDFAGFDRVGRSSSSHARSAWLALAVAVPAALAATIVARAGPQAVLGRDPGDMMAAPMVDLVDPGPTAPMAPLDDASTDDIDTGETALAAAPGNARAATRRAARAAVQSGRRALQRGDRRAAEAEFLRAIDLDPYASGPAAGLAEIYMQTGRHRRALKFARLAVRHAPNHPEYRVRLGDSQARLGRLDEARGAYAAAAWLGSVTGAHRLAALATTEPELPAVTD